LAKSAQTKIGCVNCPVFRSQILLRQLSYIKLIDEIQRAKSPKYTIAQGYERGYTFEFGSDPAGINLYLDHGFELNSELKALVKMIRPNISPELYAKLLNCQATSYTVERSFSMLGKRPPFLPKKFLEIFSIVCKQTAWVGYCRLQSLRINATFVENKCNFLTFLLRINATFVENECNFLTFLLQQKLAVFITLTKRISIKQLACQRKFQFNNSCRPVSRKNWIAYIFYSSSGFYSKYWLLILFR